MLMMTMFCIAMRLVLIKDDNGLHEHEVGGRVEKGEAEKREVGIEAIEGRGPKLP